MAKKAKDTPELAPMWVGAMSYAGSNKLSYRQRLIAEAKRDGYARRAPHN